MGKKLGLEKGAHYQRPAKSSLPLPGPASLSQAELNPITSSEYVIIVFMGHILGARYCSKASHMMLNFYITLSERSTIIIYR